MESYHPAYRAEINCWYFQMLGLYSYLSATDLSSLDNSSESRLVAHLKTKLWACQSQRIKQYVQMVKSIKSKPEKPEEPHQTSLVKPTTLSFHSDLTIPTLGKTALKCLLES